MSRIEFRLETDPKFQIKIQSKLIRAISEPVSESFRTNLKKHFKSRCQLVLTQSYQIRIIPNQF